MTVPSRRTSPSSSAAGGSVRAADGQDAPIDQRGPGRSDVGLARQREQVGRRWAAHRHLHRAQVRLVLLSRPVPAGGPAGVPERQVRVAVGQLRYRQPDLQGGAAVRAGCQRFQYRPVQIAVQAEQHRVALAERAVRIAAAERPENGKRPLLPPRRQRAFPRCQHRAARHPRHLAHPASVGSAGSTTWSSRSKPSYSILSRSIATALAFASSSGAWYSDTQQR